MEKERLGYIKLKKERFMQRYGRETLISVISVFVLVIFLTGTSYAIFTDLDQGSAHNTVTVGNLAVTFNDTATGLGGVIDLDNMLPMSYADAMQTTPYKFKITNSGNVKAEVTIALQNDTAAITSCGCSSNLINNEHIKYQLVDETNAITYEPQPLKASGNLLTVTLNTSASITYALRVWVREEALTSFAEVSGHHFHKKIIIATTQVTPKLLTDAILGVNEGNVIEDAASTTKAAVTQSVYNANPTLQTVYAVENGLYKAVGEGGKNTYFFRGGILNNNITFAGINWKIVRVNEDETIRLIKTDTTSIGTSAWNATNGLYKYTGYMFDGTTNSTIKTNLETWYTNNLNNYDRFIATSKYCNDLTEPMVGSNISITYTRRTNGTPTFICPSAHTYNLKIGLLSADEATYAGIRNTTSNSSNYLKSVNFFLMSPYSLSGSIAYQQAINSSGAFVNVSISTSSYYMRPVINLVPTVKVTGTGTIADPYIVVDL